MRERWSHRGGLAQAWRVEQHGVVAHDPPAGPVGLQDHVDKRVVDRAVALQSDETAAIGTALQRHAQIGDGGVVVETGSAKGFWRGHRGAQGGGFFRVDFQNVNFSAQRLSQRRLDHNGPQRQSLGCGRRQADQGGSNRRKRRVK